jgi:hypothetical protein
LDDQVRSIVLYIIFFALLASSGEFMNESLANSGEKGTGIVGDETDADQKEARRMNIRIVIGSMNMTATLEDNPTALDFFSLLPLALTFRDFGAAEKVSGVLPKRLSEEGAPATDAGVVATSPITRLGEISLFTVGMALRHLVSSRLQRSLPESKHLANRGSCT